MEKNVMKRKILEIIQNEASDDRKKLDELMRHPDFPVLFESVCSEIEADWEDGLEEATVPGIEEIVVALSESPCVHEPFKGIGEKIEQKLFGRLFSERVLFSKSKAERPRPKMDREGWEIFSPSLLPASYAMAASTDLKETAWHPLGEPWRHGKFILTVLQNDERRLMKVLVYNEEDQGHIPPIEVRIEWEGQSLSGTIVPLENCPTAGVRVFESPGSYVSRFDISFRSELFEASYRVSRSRETRPDIAFEPLKIYGRLGHPNHVIAYSIPFWQSVLHFLETSPYHPVYRLCESALKYLQEAVSRSINPNLSERQQLKDTLERTHLLLLQKTDAPILEKVKRAIRGLEEKRDEAKGPSRTGEVRSLFYYEGDGEKGNGSYGFVWTLCVGERKGQPSFCSPCFNDESILSSIRESFEAVVLHLEKYGLTRVFSLENCYLDLQEQYPDQDDVVLRLKDGSIGLSSALAFFSHLLKGAYPEEESPFDIPPHIAATGNVHAREGNVGEVAGVLQKLSALSKEHPGAVVYVPKKEQTLCEIQSAFPLLEVHAVESLEEMLCHIFAGGEHEVYERNIREATARLNRNHDLEKVVIYWVVPMAAGLKTDVGPLTEELRSSSPPEVMAWQCREGDTYLVCRNKEGERQTASEINRKGWKEGRFCPSMIESYATLEDSRYPAEFKRRRAFLRLELSAGEFALPERETSKAVGLFNHGLKQAVLSLTEEGTAFVTLQTEMWRPDLDTLCSYSRKEFQKALGQRVNEMAHRFSFLVPREKKEVEPYLFLVVRETKHFKTAGAEVVSSDLPLFYSILTGSRRERVSKEAQEWLLGQNQSTRQDVFMAVTPQQALLVEARGRKEVLTKKNICPNASESLVEARDVYNDLNYLIWIEMLLSLNESMASPGASREQAGRWFRQTRGSLVARHITYQHWVDLWKNILGAHGRYEMMMEESKALPNLCGQKEKSTIVSGVGVVFNEKGEALITRRNVSPFLGQWVMPGGTAEFGESIRETVIREVEEEVGVRLSCGEILGFKESLPSEASKFRHYLILYFRMEISSDPLRPNPEEISEIAWVDGTRYASYDLAPKAREILDQIYGEK